MKKNVLVLGGSYFVGRVFTRLTERTGQYDLHIVNRGTYPLKIDTVTQYACDRHDSKKLATSLPALNWDAVVDFCAYEPGDAASLLAAIPGTVAQYIYISTCSVYEPSAPSPKTEDSPLLAAGGDDPGHMYAYKKLVLEREATEVCVRDNTALTILRPAFIYGPLNYAPRESFYFNCILEKKPIPSPTDATGRFQFVYVKDVAKMIMGCIGNKAAYGEAYNLSAPECMDYGSFVEVLANVHGRPLNLEPVTVEEVYARNIPVPFPLDSDELYSGDKISLLLSLRYIPFAGGMRETYAIYMDAHAT